MIDKRGWKENFEVCKRKGKRKEGGGEQMRTCVTLIVCMEKEGGETQER